MNGIQKHQRSNRMRRIPRRIHQLSTELLAVQKRIDQIENDETIADGVKSAMIRSLRDEVSPANVQIRSLVDRGHELGIAPSFLNAA